MSTSRGRTIRGPSASDLVGALLAAAPDDPVAVFRDLGHLVYAMRLDAHRFVVWVRDGSLARQVRIDHQSVHDVAAMLIAFATRADFTREVVDAVGRHAAA